MLRGGRFNVVVVHDGTLGEAVVGASVVEPAVEVVLDRADGRALRSVVEERSMPMAQPPLQLVSSVAIAAPSPRLARPESLEAPPAPIGRRRLRTSSSPTSATR